MTHAIAIPKLGLTMEEATLVEWHREDGQRVAKGDTIFSIETDKIVADVEAEHDGFLQRVAALNERLPVGALVGYLHASAEAAVAGKPAQAAQAASGASPAPAQGTLPAPVAAPAAAPAAHPATLAAGMDANGQRLMVSPVARSLAQARDIELRGLQGSGPGGVILKRDVEAAAANARPAAPLPGAPIGPAASRRQPMSAMRRAISERMMKSLSSTAQMTGFGKVDMTEAVKLRNGLVAAADHLGVRITYTDIVIKAAATVLAQMPGLNSYIDGQDVVTWTDVNIGMAVSVEGGLVVPVIRHADRLSLVDIARQRLALAERARAGRLAREDVEGGTFTVSNFGSYGGDFETPILNAPQSALLGIGQIADEPVVRDKQIAIAAMMSISLTFDHRLIDGAMAGEFRRRLKALLEAPAMSAGKAG